MAKLKKANTAPVEEVEEVTEEVMTEEDAQEKYMEKMTECVNLVAKEFNLTDRGFVVRAATDKGNSYKLTLSNDEFEVSVTINNLEKHNISQ